jgi:chitin deacetylase
MEIKNELVPVGKVAKWDYNKKAAVVLTFDDWSAGHPAIVVPELKSRNMNATFSIVPSLITDWNSLENAVTDGNELANHTKTHVYCNSASVYVSEGAAAKSIIETNVPSQKVSTFIYPYGLYDDALIGYLKADGYVGARGVYPSSGNYTYNFAPTINDYYKILTYSIDNTVTTSAFNTQVQNIISGGGLLTFLYHSINSPTIVDNNYAPISQSALQAQLDVLQLIKIVFGLQHCQLL